MKSLYSFFESVNPSKITELQNKLRSAVKARRGTKEALIKYLGVAGERRSDKKFNKTGIELGIKRSGYNDGFYILDWNTYEIWSILGNFGKTLKDTLHIKDKNAFSEHKEIYDFGTFIEDIYEIDEETKDFLVKIFF